jgi:hypothetical protein
VIVDGDEEQEVVAAEAVGIERLLGERGRRGAVGRVDELEPELDVLAVQQVVQRRPDIAHAGLQDTGLVGDLALERQGALREDGRMDDEKEGRGKEERSGAAENRGSGVHVDILAEVGSVTTMTLVPPPRFAGRPLCLTRRQGPESAGYDTGA